MVSLYTSAWRIDSIHMILFDKDGTLIDSHPYWGRIIERRARAIIARYNLNDHLFSDLCQIMGFSLDERRLLEEGPIALVSREEVIDVVSGYLECKGISAPQNEIADIFSQEHDAFKAELFDYLHILPAVREFLADLRNHSIRIGVVTSDTVVNTQEAFRYLGIGHYFDVIIGKESTKEAKVTGKPAIEALQQFSLDSHDAVSIGDAPMDILMAKNAGLKAGVGVASGQISIATLQEYTPYVVSSLEELSIA